jgi:hypothetical protein
MMRVSRGARTVGALVVLVASALLLAAVGGAVAAGRAPGFVVESVGAPSVFSSGDDARCLATVAGGPPPVCDAFEVFVHDAGGAATEGGPVSVEDVVPAGLTVQRIGLFWSGAVAREFGLSDEDKEQVDLGFLCSVASVSCSFPLPLGPDERLEMVVYVTAADGSERALVNRAVASGGGAAVVSAESTARMGGSPAGFGVSGFGFSSVGLDGALDRQAGDHPYELRVSFALNSVFRVGPQGGFGKWAVQDVKDVAVDLPLGFVGSTLAAPECTLAQLSSQQRCPRDTQVGFLAGAEVVHSPIWNMVPDRGVPAEFGFIDSLKASHVLYTHVVPSPAGYVLEAVSPDIPEVNLSHIVATFFGDPAERDGTGNAQIPFFTNPAICSGAAMTATIHVDSWVRPGRLNADGTPDLSDPAWVSRSSSSAPPVGCNALQFTPELRAQPTTEAADSPSGMDFELRLAQSELAGTNATPPLRDASVTFPEGFTLDPSAGNGLQACSEAQIGWEEAAVGPDKFNRIAPSCPEASKVGVLELETPLIPGVLTGEMYLAAQNENPFHSVFGLYVVVRDPVTGVLVKIAGHVHSDPTTGRVTGIFEENPQLPFSDLKLHFFGGPRAEFATPEACGVFTTTSDLAPWSAPDSGPDATPFSSFQIGSGCVSGFAPRFKALSTNVQAGAFTPFVASFSRSDTDQELAGLSLSLPAGLLARITGVALCSDADANAGTCPEASRVGSVTAFAGPGPNPLATNGKAYLTGPYRGAPYGLVVVVPAVAGPFDFGLVKVRQALYIDPSDAHATDVSDPFPTILQPVGQDNQTAGIPIRLRRVDVSIDRAGFTFNPTNCSRLAVAGTISSTQGSALALTAPFQVTNCANLKFTPRFSVTVSGRTSKANGASLTARVSYPSLPQGTEANIAFVKVSLPKQLPSRLTTLQKACLAATFERNPAECPAHSIVGHASVTTPLLPQPLTGPAYFVSHGGQAFPSLTIVLQGNNVTVHLVGATFISKAGITSTTFNTVPDVPFNTFQLTLPQGPFSALTANTKLCNPHLKLLMPTIFKAQNGLQHTQTTHITTTNCPTHHHKHHKH